MIKTFFISTGIACLLSAPISRVAMFSWENPKTEITYNEFSEASSLAICNIGRIAEAQKRITDERNALVQAELDRQEQIENDARYILECYQVELPQDIQTYCEEAGAEFNICPEFLEAIAWKESRFTADAENKGCSGIMQISVKWHKNRMEKLGVTDIYDARGNIRVAADYLTDLFQKYDGDVDLVLKEYNGDTSKGVSTYAIEIMQVSEALERIHGK